MILDVISDEFVVLGADDELLGDAVFVRTVVVVEVEPIAAFRGRLHLHVAAETG